MRLDFIRVRVAEYVLIIWASTTLLCACKVHEDDQLFHHLSSGETGINFNNLIDDAGDSTLISEFSYMGGGVGIGDFNNDGLKDIYFTGNKTSSRLYINKGDNHFEDITVRSGTSTHVWATGVTIADVNNDGFDDIFVSVWGTDLYHGAKNLLFINQHNLTFKEESAEYGLNDSLVTSQAVFVDYDKDGDLDLFLCNYYLNGPNANNIVAMDTSGKGRANDKLYRSDWSRELGHPVFHDVTSEAGIKENGYGLGICAGDFNNDGWTDIYVANDFLYNDELWLNKKNGTFTNIIETSTRHQSYSSMGCDIADINNDGLLDLCTLDMMPETNERKKQTFSFMNIERYDMERSLGYQPEFSRNMLQLNAGVKKDNLLAVPLFSEIGQLAGLSETDWSWSVLMADFDNDGWNDMYITNGIGRDFINADFGEFMKKATFDTHNLEDRKKEINGVLRSLNSVKLSNYLFLNNRDLTFRNASDNIGGGFPSLSNGAAYVDLDNDGDLDLVVNNINDEPFVLENMTIQKHKPIVNHFLELTLATEGLNRQAIGSRVQVFTGNTSQISELNPVRGYLSCVDRTLHFGLGHTQLIDSVIITWPDGQIQVLKKIQADKILTVHKNSLPATLKTSSAEVALFEDVTDQMGALYKHTEEPFNDFAYQPLLLQKYSQLGPGMAVADIDMDGIQDFFIGGAFHYSGAVFKQDREGTMHGTSLTDGNKLEEDGRCTFVDINNDKHPDLIITGADVPYTQGDPLQPRVYINDGHGNFKLKKGVIPPNVAVISTCITAADYDHDGYMDLFIGGRVSAKYPQPPHSYILHNEHGTFKDVTAKVCPSLERVGMVTSAVWVDYDNDQQLDLVVTGDFMPIKFFKNSKGVFTDESANTGLADNFGLWRSLVACDLDGDGDFDLVAGNLGLNNKFNATPATPFKVFASDIDSNGTIDPIPFYFIKSNDGQKHLFPALSKNLLMQQVPSLKKHFLTNNDFAKADFKSIYGENPVAYEEYTCNELASCIFENKGNGKFVKHRLPTPAQFSSVNAILCHDFDQDGIKDILIAGNEYQSDIYTGRYDASYGLLLKGGRLLHYTPVSPIVSGFVVSGEVTDMAVMHTAKKQSLVLVAINNDSLKVFRCLK